MDKIDYYDKGVKPILEGLVFEILCEKPTDLASYMIDWLQKTGGYTSNGLTLDEKKELEKLRIDIGDYRKRDIQNNTFNSSDNDDENDNYKGVELDIKKKALKGKGKRIGVSSESYGKYNKKQDFKARVIPKSNEQKLRIRGRILQSILFNNLETEEVEIIINAMEEKLFEPKQYVIKQGEEGDCLFVIDKGELECYKQFSKDTIPKLVKDYAPGEAFGELALLYNAQRAASVIAKTPCILWALDRETFINIAKESAVKKRQKYENFLKSVTILANLDAYEISMISDALKTCSYKENDFVIKEGEIGDVFYIVEEGEAVATKRLELGKLPVDVKKYGKGDYFGELALIRGEPRAANVIAKTRLKLITIDRGSFKRLLGPLEEILKRNSQEYIKPTIK